MRDARRRNRHIGTAKSGHGRDNRMLVPEPWADARQRRSVSQRQQEACRAIAYSVAIVDERDFWSPEFPTPVVRAALRSVRRQHVLYHRARLPLLPVRRERWLTSR